MSQSIVAVSEEEYLRTRYRPDRELIDGELREKPMPTRLHAYTQMLIGHWFLLHMDQWQVMAMSEVRTKVKPGRFRLPDVAVTYAERPEHKPLEKAPLIAIEVLSPEDSFSDLWKRAQDFSKMGSNCVWLVDPETQQAYTYMEAHGWMKTANLQVPGTPIRLDLSWLWSQLDKFGITDEPETE